MSISSLLLTQARDPNAIVDDGATYWGMLYYRGAIMCNLRDSLPIHQWGIQEVIAMFCSGIDQNHSFSRLYYSETRSRLMFALYKRVALRLKHVKGGGANDNIAVLVGYTLACMEYEGGNALGDFYDKNKPIQHMHRFAELYMKYYDDFPTFNDNQNKHIRKDVAKYLLECTYMPEYSQILNDSIKDNMDFMFSGGIEQIESVAYKKRRNRTSRRPGQGKSADGASESPMVLITDDTRTVIAKRATGLGFSLPYVYKVSYDPARIVPYAKNDAFVRALIEPMPHVRTEVKLKLEDSLNDFRAIKASLGLDDDKKADVDEPDDMVAFKLLLQDITIPGMIQLRDKESYEAELGAAEAREADLMAADLRAVEDDEMEDEDGCNSEDMDMSE